MAKALLRVVVLLVALLTASAYTYAEEGPYAFSRLRWKHGVPSKGFNGRPLVLDFTITFPTDANGDDDAPCPVVFFFSGFEMPSTFYSPYAQKMASWGYVVVQYDVPILPIIDDKTETSFFPYILSWITSQMRHSALPTNIDYDAVAVGGHSRGGKLAALVAAENPNVKAMFLIDPVDGDGRHAKGDAYPSAVSALQGRNLKMAIAGSSISGSCNPVDYDFRHFWEMAGDGSWLTVVARAGHCQFLSAPPARQWILNRLCKSGRISSKDVIESTTPSIVAWLESTFRTLSTNGEEETNETTHLYEFFLWVESKARSGALTFSIKGHESVQV